MRVDVNTAVEVNDTVRETLRVCKEVNAFNAAQRDDALLAAQIAIGQIAILEDELEDLIGDTFEPADTECRTLDEPLPVDFRDWLCIDGAANCNPD